MAVYPYVSMTVRSWVKVLCLFDPTIHPSYTHLLFFILFRLTSTFADIITTVLASVTKKN